MKNLLPLGVSGGLSKAGFVPVLPPASPCRPDLRRFLRRFLRHPLKANTDGDERRKEDSKCPAWHEVVRAGMASGVGHHSPPVRGLAAGTLLASVRLDRLRLFCPSAWRAAALRLGRAGLRARKPASEASEDVVEQIDGTTLCYRLASQTAKMVEARRSPSVAAIGERPEYRTGPRRATG